MPLYPIPTETVEKRRRRIDKLATRLGYHLGPKRVTVESRTVPDGMTRSGRIPQYRVRAWSPIWHDGPTMETALRYAVAALGQLTAQRNTLPHAIDCDMGEDCTEGGPQ